MQSYYRLDYIHTLVHIQLWQVDIGHTPNAVSYSWEQCSAFSAARATVQCYDLSYVVSTHLAISRAYNRIDMFYLRYLYVVRNMNLKSLLKTTFCSTVSTNGSNLLFLNQNSMLFPYLIVSKPNFTLKCLKINIFCRYPKTYIPMWSLCILKQYRIYFAVTLARQPRSQIFFTHILAKVLTLGISNMRRISWLCWYIYY